MSGEYPTDEEIARVKSWEFKRRGAFGEFMEYVRSIGNYWTWPDPFGWNQEGRVYHISTGGWSGNEEILGAMQENWIFWAVCWQEHRRGGHYKFELPDEAVYFKTGD